MWVTSNNPAPRPFSYLYDYHHYLCYSSRTPAERLCPFLFSGRERERKKQNKTLLKTAYLAICLKPSADTKFCTLMLLCFEGLALKPSMCSLCRWRARMEQLRGPFAAVTGGGGGPQSDFIFWNYDFGHKKICVSLTKRR